MRCSHLRKSGNLVGVHILPFFVLLEVTLNKLHFPSEIYLHCLTSSLHIVTILLHIAVRNFQLFILAKNLLMDDSQFVVVECQFVDLLAQLIFFVEPDRLMNVGGCLLMEGLDCFNE